MGGPEEMPAGDAGADTGAPAGGAGDAPAGGDAGGGAGGGDESPLLAVPPGSRDVRQYEKSSYVPAKRDRRKDSGPRKETSAAKYNAEKRPR